MVDPRKVTTALVSCGGLLLSPFRGLGVDALLEQSSECSLSLQYIQVERETFHNLNDIKMYPSENHRSGRRCSRMW
jgi:hypothetical protein